MATKEVKGAVLAQPLADIATTGERVEKAATGLLAAIRKAGMQTLGAFDDAVALAVEANRWNARPGRPAKDRRQIPHSVRTYVWEIRSAYRAGLEVWKFHTMYELRMAKKALKEESRIETTGGDAEEATPLIPVEVAQDLEGVRVVDVKRPNGALFHDLICTFVALPNESRALFGRQLSRLNHRYAAEVKTPQVEQPAPGTRGRKVASA